jgi:hypothetical protein
MTNTTTAKSEARPYKPSWIDRSTDWVDNLPLRARDFYVGLGLALILCQMLFLWLDGGLQAEALLPVIIFNGLVTPFLVGLIHLLDNQAVAALKAMRPTLEMTVPEFDEFQYRLSSMPSRVPLMAGLTMMVIAILTERLGGAPTRYAALEQLPTFAVVYHLFDKLSAFVFGIVIYHTIRQLHLVNSIHSKHTRISLFNMGPLQSFSKLTATTAVGLVVGVYAWILINPEFLTNPITLGFSGSVTILAVAVFVWPLLGAHRRMEMEKARMLHDIDLHFEAVSSKLDQRLRDEDYSAIERLNGTIASLEIRHKRIAAIPTWPWRPETARFVLAAVALPLVLTVLQFLAERALIR